MLVAVALCVVSFRCREGVFSSMPPLPPPPRTPSVRDLYLLWVWLPFSFLLLQAPSRWTRVAWMWVAIFKVSSCWWILPSLLYSVIYSFFFSEFVSKSCCSVEVTKVRWNYKWNEALGVVPSSNSSNQLNNCCEGSWEGVGNVVVAQKTQLGELSVEGLVAEGEESWKEKNDWGGCGRTGAGWWC